MQREEFKVSINATKEKVWNVLWDDATYRKWTSVFGEGSHYVSDLEEGSKVKFLGEKDSGMLSEVAEKRMNEYMGFRHIGMIMDGVEDTTSEKVKNWSGAMETYRLDDNNGNTELTVGLDMNDEYRDMFMDLFPKALQKIKELSE